MIISGFESVGVWVRSDRFLRSSHGDIYTCSISDWAMCNNCKGIVCASCKTCDGGGGFADGHSRSCGPIKFVVTILYNICITITVGVCPSEGNTRCCKVTVFEVCHNLAVGNGGEVDGDSVGIVIRTAIGGYTELIISVFVQTCNIDTCFGYAGSINFIVGDVVYSVSDVVCIVRVGIPCKGSAVCGLIVCLQIGHFKTGLMCYNNIVNGSRSA